MRVIASGPAALSGAARRQESIRNSNLHPALVRGSTSPRPPRHQRFGADCLIIPSNRVPATLSTNSDVLSPLTSGTNGDGREQEAPIQLPPDGSPAIPVRGLLDSVDARRRGTTGDVRYRHDRGERVGQPYHDRMSVILSREGAKRCLTPGPLDASEVAWMLGPVPAEGLLVEEVSAAVNNARVDSPRCVEPPDAGGLFEGALQ